MRIFAIFPNSYMKTTSVHTMETPAKALEQLGVICITQEDFFAKYMKNVYENDIVIMWIGTRNEDHIKYFSNLKCKKFLRNIDTYKSDRIRFKREIEIFKPLGFSAMLLTYCTERNKKFLNDQGISTIDYPHLIDFENSKFIPLESREFDIVSSGDITQKEYPLRFKIFEALTKTREFSTIRLNQPGYEKKAAQHDIFGEKYVDFLSNSRIGITCAGDRDGAMHMKYLEFAKAGILPIGDCPDNMPIKAKNAMIEVNEESSDDEIYEKLRSVLTDKSSLKDRIVTYKNEMMIYDIGTTEKILNRIKEF